MESHRIRHVGHRPGPFHEQPLAFLQPHARNEARRRLAEDLLHATEQVRAVLRQRVSQAACLRVRQQFCVERVVPMYERCYLSVLD